MLNIGLGISPLLGGRVGPPQPAVLFTSAGSFPENIAAATALGTLSVVNATGTPSYSLTFNDTNRVAISGANVTRGAAAWDYETHPIVSFTITTTGTTPAVPPRTFDITVTNVLETILAALTLTPATVDENVAIGTVVGAIGGRTAGSTLILFDDALGKFAISGTNVVTAAAIDFEVTGPSLSITIRETHPDAAPRDTVKTITVTDVSDTTTLAALTLSASTISESATIGTVVGAVQGKTGGSTLDLTGTAGGKFVLSGLNIVTAAALDYETATSHSISITETLAGATNSPRVTPLTITVTDVTEITLAPLTLSANTILEGAAPGTMVGGILGQTSGSTLELFDDAGDRFAFGAAGDASLTLDLDFTTGTLDSKVTFTRTTVATYVNASGAVAASAINAARFDHNPSTLAPRGFLLEEQRTNLVLQSNDFTNGTWLTYGDGTASGSRAASAVLSPDGVSTAALWTMNRTESAASRMQLFQVFTGTAATHTLSVYLKAKAGSEGKVVTIFMNDGAAFVGVKNVTLTANWVRYETPGLLTASAGCQAALGYLYSTNGGGTQTGLVEVYVWGGQVEAGAFATSYVPTTSAAVTRAADVAVMTGTNFSSWWNASAGTFVAGFDGPASGTRPIVSADDNTANEVIMLYGSGTDPKASVTDGGATQADLDAGTLAANTAAKLGLSFAANDFAACLNGGTVALDTGGTLPTVTQARLGAGPAANYLTGHLASLKFYNVAKTDAELQALTT